MNNPEKTAEAFFGGLPAYHTGDVGSMTDPKDSCSTGTHGPN